MTGWNASPRRPAASEGDFMKVDTVWLGDPQQHVPFFQDLSDTERRHPALVAVQKQYSDEARVIAKGSRPANLFLLLSGVARVTETAPQSEGIQATAFLARSLTPAEDSQHRDGLLLLDGAANSVSVQTVDSCLFLARPREEFLDFLARSPRLIPRLLYSLRGGPRA